jgi:uncharacterized membrane protein (UPF0127 family)
VRRIRGIPGVFTALLLLAACQKAEECQTVVPAFVFPLPIDTVTATVRTGDSSASLLVEVARTQEQKEIGLGIRPSLDPCSGMIFPYDSVQSATTGYWMWRMKIPLDMAFLDSTGVVVKLFEDLEPCDAVYAQACPTTVPGVPYWSVFETNGGWFAENGAGEGSVVTVGPR